MLSDSLVDMQGRQEHPGFPRPLIQELSIKLPFKRTDPKEALLEEQCVLCTHLLQCDRLMYDVASHVKV